MGVTFSSVWPSRLSRPAGTGAIPTYPTPPLMPAIQIAPPARTCHLVSTYVLFLQVRYHGVSVTFIILGDQDERGGMCDAFVLNILTISAGWQHSSVWCVHVRHPPTSIWAAAA